MITKTAVIALMAASVMVGQVQVQPKTTGVDEWNTIKGCVRYQGKTDLP